MINNFEEEPFFDVNPDVKKAIEDRLFDSLAHYMDLSGVEEIKVGTRSFHKDFEPYNEILYLSSFPDVKKAVEQGTFLKGFGHFYHHGYKEILSGHRFWPGRKEKNITVLLQNFDKEAYFQVNPDVKEAIENGTFVSLEQYFRIVGLSDIQNALRRYHKDLEPFSEIEYYKVFPEVEVRLLNDKVATAFDHFCENGYMEMLRRLNR